MVTYNLYYHRYVVLVLNSIHIFISSAENLLLSLQGIKVNRRTQNMTLKKKTHIYSPETLHGFQGSRQTVIFRWRFSTRNIQL